MSRERAEAQHGREILIISISQSPTAEPLTSRFYSFKHDSNQIAYLILNYLLTLWTVTQNMFHEFRREKSEMVWGTASYATKHKNLAS